MIKGTLLTLVAIHLLLVGCHTAVKAPNRPATVPASAVWAGGADGGAYIDCVPSQDGRPNTCTVYDDDQTGDVSMSGWFMLKDQKRGATQEQLQYSYADGQKIGLKNGLTLVPTSTPRPASVPKGALLAENGIYVDCHTSGSDLFECSLFLAANGERVVKNTYRCDSSLSMSCAGQAPKGAGRSHIFLQNAGALDAVSKPSGGNSGTDGTLPRQRNPNPPDKRP